VHNITKKGAKVVEDELSRCIDDIALDKWQGLRASTLLPRARLPPALLVHGVHVLQETRASAHHKSGLRIEARKLTKEAILDEWLLLLKKYPDTFEGLDEILVHLFYHFLYFGLESSEESKIAGVVQHMMPAALGWLPRCWRAVNGWRRLAPPLTRLPLPWLGLMSMGGAARHIDSRRLGFVPHQQERRLRRKRPPRPHVHAIDEPTHAHIAEQASTHVDQGILAGRARGGGEDHIEAQRRVAHQARHLLLEAHSASAACLDTACDLGIRHHDRGQPVQALSGDARSLRATMPAEQQAALIAAIRVAKRAARAKYSYVPAVALELFNSSGSRSM
jgi:hypothetical protein